MMLQPLEYNSILVPTRESVAMFGNHCVEIVLSGILIEVVSRRPTSPLRTSVYATTEE
jgi:hypothetical protein